MFGHLQKLVVWLLIAGGIWWLWPAGELRHEPGVRLEREPEQQTIAPQVVANFKKYTITAVAAYAIEARVLRTKKYWADGNDLVPYDVAVGWGAMSDQAVLDRLSISQGNRFFFYEWQNPPPIAPDEIMTHAANMHVIAANKEVAKAVKRLRRGQFVAMRGYLVNVGVRCNGFLDQHLFSYWSGGGPRKRRAFCSRGRSVFDGCCSRIRCKQRSRSWHRRDRQRSPPGAFRF